MRGVTPLRLLFSCRFLFQLTRLMRGVTFMVKRCIIVLQFQLTRLMRGVTAERSG